MTGLSKIDKAALRLLSSMQGLGKVEFTHRGFKEDGTPVGHGRILWRISVEDHRTPDEKIEYDIRYRKLKRRLAKEKVP